MRKGWTDGVAAALPLTVRADELVDSVDPEVVVERGLLKAEVIGDTALSSRKGDFPVVLWLLGDGDEADID